MQERSIKYITHQKKNFILSIFLLKMKYIIKIIFRLFKYLLSIAYHFYAKKIQEYFFYQRIKSLKRDDFNVKIYSIKKEYIELHVFLEKENINLKKKDIIFPLNDTNAQKEIFFRFSFSQASKEILSQDYRFYNQLKNYIFTTKTKKCMRFFKKYKI
jgi:hypothetical protein